MDDFTSAIDIDPDYFYAYIFRGGILDRLGKRKKAIADYTKVLEGKPDYYYIYSPLGMLLYIEEKWEAARMYLDQAYQYEPEEYLYPFLVAFCYKEQGLEFELGGYIKAALAEIPRESVFYTVGRLFVETGADGYVAGVISNERNIRLKMKALLILAMYYELEGYPSLAQKYYLVIEEKAVPTSLERRLALAGLEKYRSEAVTND